MFPPKTFAAARSRALSRWVEGFAAFFGCVEGPRDADGVADSTAAAGRLRADAGVKTSVTCFWICSAHSSSLRIPEALNSWSRFVLAQKSWATAPFRRRCAFSRSTWDSERSLCVWSSLKADRPSIEAFESTMLAIKCLFEHRCRSSLIEQQRSTSTATAVERREICHVSYSTAAVPVHSCTVVQQESSPMMLKHWCS